MIIYSVNKKYDCESLWKTKLIQTLMKETIKKDPFQYE